MKTFGVVKNLQPDNLRIGQGVHILPSERAEALAKEGMVEILKDKNGFLYIGLPVRDAVQIMINYDGIDEMPEPL